MSTATRVRAFYDVSNCLRNDGIIETVSERIPGHPMAVGFSEACEYAERLRQEEIAYFERDNESTMNEINRLTASVVQNAGEINRLKALEFKVR